MKIYLLSVATLLATFSFAQNQQAPAQGIAPIQTPAHTHLHQQSVQSSGHVGITPHALTPISTAPATPAGHTCKTHQLNQQHYADRGILNEFNQSAMDGIQSVVPTSLNKTPNANEISVIFHVVHNPNNPAENVSNAQIMTVFNDLVEDFQLLNADASNARTGLGFVPADANINFCLATQDPLGNPLTEVGVVRVATTEDWYDSDNGEENKMKSSVTGGSDIWDRNDYLNIWICDITNGASSGTAGYAYRPTTMFLPSPSIDGIVIDYNLGVNNDNILTHEVGHYLGLDHPWGGSGGCGNDDGFADTPNTAGPSFNYPGSCSGSQQTCGAVEVQYENYMDYSNCTVMFTQNQADYMLTILQGIRGSLLLSPGCDPVNAPPVVDFTADIADPIIIPVGGSVNFTSLATNAPTSWTWDFGGGAPATTVENPNVTFNTIGTYTVTHTATNVYGTGSETKTNHVQVVATASGTGCDTLRNYNPADNFFTLFGAAGYIQGHEQLSGGTVNVLEWAEPYTATVSTQVRRLRFAPSRVNDGGGSVTFKVYSATPTPGEPNAAVATETVALSSLTELVWNEIDFTTPATVTGAFWVGYEVSYANPADTFALLSTYSLAPTPTIDFTMLNADGFGWFQVSAIYGDGGANSLGTAFIMDVLTSTGPDPTASFTYSDTAICVGGNVVVNGSGSTNTTDYFWYRTDDPLTTILETANSAGVTFNFPDVGGHSIYLFADGSCRSDLQIVDITVDTTITATVTSTNTTCGNNNGTITVSGANGGTGTYSYSLDGVNWQASNVFNSVGAGTYTVYIRTDGNNCESTYSATVGGSSSFTAGVDPNVSICPGASATISASGGVSYQWYDGGTLIASTASTSVTPSATTQYTCIVTNGSGCQSTVQQTVTLFTPATAPTITASGPTTICDGTTVDLTSSYPTNNLWSTSETSSTITVGTSGNYAVQYTDGNGCTVLSAITTVTVLSSPVISSGTVTDPSSCGTATGSIQVSGSGSGDVSWSGTASGNANSVSLPYTITGLAAGAYNITFTDGNGCTSNLLAQAINDPNPPTQPTITPGGATTFCDGGSVTLSSSYASGNSWTTSETTQDIVVTTSGSYSVTYTDGNGCSASSAPITITVNPTPGTPTITPTGATTFCDGGSVLLSSSQGSGNVWSTSETTQDITVSTSGTYSVTYTDGNGCSATSAGTTVTVNPLPTVTQTAIGDVCDYDADFTLTGGSPAGGTYSGTGVSGGQFSPSTAGVGTHTITYEFTDGNGCTNTTTTDITVDGCVSVEEIIGADVNVYPNPTESILHIEAPGEFVFKLYDTRGRIVFHGSALEVTSIDVSTYESGVYLLKLNGTTYDSTVRIMKR